MYAHVDRHEDNHCHRYNIFLDAFKDLVNFFEVKKKILKN